MICFCYFCQKKFFSILGVAHNNPFSVQIGSKKTTFKRFYQLFFRTTGLQHKLLILLYPLTYFIGNQPKKVKWVWSLGHNLGQIRSNIVKKTKELLFQWVFFIFCLRYTFISKKVVVAEISEWKLKTMLARNTLFEGN